MKRSRFARSGLSALLVATAILASVAPASGQPGAGMVQPESLEQGFLIVVKDLSGMSGPASPLYLASNHNGWNPGDPAMRLEGRSDMRWQISLPKFTDGSTLEFKITRGSWDQCEVAADLKDIPNRTLPKVDGSKLAPGEKATIEITVPKFSDQRPAAVARKGVDPYRPLEVTGQVRRLQVVGGAPTGGARVRDVLVWLPPGYDDPKHADWRFPVLYLADGQNVFEQLTGMPGEWHVDETLTELIAANKIKPLIIVAVPHAGVDRVSEYLPVAAMDGVEPRADQYLDFLTREVMPRVDRTFRVAAGPENTAIGGASLGAVISLYAATKRPDLFGAVLIESSPTLSGPGGAWESYLENAQHWPAKVYIGMGGHETGPDPANDALNAAYVESAKALDALVASKGIDQAHRKLVIDPDATHGEAAWAKRFAAAIEFLFPAVNW